MREHTFTDPIYRAQILVLYGDDFSQWRKQSRFNEDVTVELLKGFATSNGQVTTWANSDDTFMDILWLRPAADVTSTLWHEALHITCRILRRRGMSLTIDSEEAWAYHQGWVVREVEAGLGLNKKGRTRRRR